MEHIKQNHPTWRTKASYVITGCIVCQARRHCMFPSESLYASGKNIVCFYRRHKWQAGPSRLLPVFPFKQLRVGVAPINHCVYYRDQRHA